MTSADRTSKRVVADDSLDELKRLLRRRKPPCVIVSGSQTAADLVRVIEELQRHRQLEHDHFWGEDDD